ncbi:MAG: porin [Hyphomicrobiaceae bacterium]|nr:porin [Hyphomicrobiaceae bacterium]
MKKYSLSALVAAGLLAGGLSVTSANAADLGGNCCADLEERIAELEATTARKGNRKVSLTVSGWVAEQVMYWDDGEESNVYVGGIGATLASHVKFTGQATISPGWTAGYVLHIEATGNENLGQNQFDDNAPQVNSGGGTVGLLQSYWFIKSDHLGKVSIGKQSQASDNTAILVDGSGSLVPANWVLFDVNNFFVRQNGGFSGLTIGGGFGGCGGMGGAGGDCNGLTENVVRYDSPTFGGFSFSTSWGEDDMWDIAARYAGEFGGFKLAAATAFTHSTDPGIGAIGDSAEADYFQVGAYAQHVPTGLFLYGAYGTFENEDVVAAELESDTYYLKAGIRQRWTPLGHTVLYGEYMNVESDFDDLASTNRELDQWGLGIVQEVDAAAMSLWLSYRHYEFDSNNALEQDLEDFDLVKFGALINF